MGISFGRTLTDSVRFSEGDFSSRAPSSSPTAPGKASSPGCVQRKPCPSPCPSGGGRLSPSRQNPEGPFRDRLGSDGCPRRADAFARARV